MITTIVLGLLLSAQPTVGSNSNCPSARDIESNLSVLLPGETAQPGTVLVSTTPDGLLVELRPKTPGSGALRSVAVGDNCEERAKAAAVVIATWWPTGAAPSVRSETQPATVKWSDTRRRLGLSVGGYASVVSGSVAPGGRAEATWTPRGQAFGLRLSLGGTGPQGGSLGQGQAHWTRAAAELGPTFSLGNLRLDGGMVASLMWIEGSGFAVNQKSTGGSLGATAGVRLGWAWGRALPWLELRGLLWPQSQRIYITDSATDLQTTRPMPHWELQLGAGIAFSLF
jgi:hypothetical protein